MVQPECSHPVTDAHIEYLKQNQLKAIDFQNPKFQDVVYAVSSNEERLALAPGLLVAFAHRHKGVAVRWKKPFAASVDLLASKLQSVVSARNLVNSLLHTNENATHGTGLGSSNVRDWLYDSYSAELHQYFVLGAKCPLVFTKNVNPACGVANGSTCSTYGLMYDNADDQEMVDSMIRKYYEDDLNGVLTDVLTIPIPTSVLLEFPDEIGKQWPANTSCVEGKYVLAFDTVVGNSKYNIKIPPTSPGSKCITVAYKQFTFEIGLVCTFYKVQGATCGSIIVDLNHRPKGLKSMDLRALFVALSRVQYGVDFRILPLEFENSLDYLKLLTIDKNLKLWRECFDVNGVFVPPPRLEDTRYQAPARVEGRERGSAREVGVGGSNGGRGGRGRGRGGGGMARGRSGREDIVAASTRLEETQYQVPDRDGVPERRGGREVGVGEKGGRRRRGRGRGLGRGRES